MQQPNISSQIFGLWLFALKFITPLGVGIILVTGILDKFFGIKLF